MADEEDTYDLAPVAPPPAAKRSPFAEASPPPPALPVSPSAQAPHPPRPVPLPYVRAGTMPGRPGILTAVAIVGIIVGLLSVLASGGTTWFWGYAWVHSQPPPPPPPGEELPPASLQAYAGETLGRRGLPRATRAKLVDAFPLKGTFAADRRAMLDRLLAEIGQDVAPSGSVQVLATKRER